MFRVLRHAWGETWLIETGSHGPAEGLASIAVSGLLRRIYQGQWDAGRAFDSTVARVS
jgi:hypothetical protein